MKTIKIIPILVLFALSFSINAQENQKDERSEKHREEHNERSKVIEEMKRNFIIERLDLSEEKATAFLALLKEYDLKKIEVKKEAYAKKKLNEGEKNNDKLLTEVEANIMLARKIEVKEKILHLEREYVAKSIEQFTAVKVLEYYKAEREFKKELLKMLKEKKRNRMEH